MKVRDMPKHERPREKLIEKGASNLSEKELLAILLGTGREGKDVLELATEIMRKYPLKKLLALGFEDVTKIKGISSAKACSLLAAFELSKRALERFDPSLPLLDSPQKVVDQLTFMRSRGKEHFVVMYLNARNQLLHKETVSVGTLTSSLVHPREVFAPALKYKAARIILAHNHPSQDCARSVEDIEVTDRLAKAGKLLGVEVIDHVIVTKREYLSFMEQGWV